MKAKKIAVLLCLPFIVFVNYAQNKVYNSTEGKVKVSSIRSELVIDKVPIPSNMMSTQQSFSAGMASILPSVIETGITIVKSNLKKREESYSAEYKVKSSGSGFWLNKKKLQLPQLNYKRYIVKKKSSDKDTAISFILIPEQSEDGLAFRYKLSHLDLNYSESRANKRKPTINLEIDIRLIAFSQSDKNYSKSELAQNSIMVEGLLFETLSRGNYYSGWFPILPQVDIPNPNGNYEIELTIKEANPGVLKTQKIIQFFDDNGEQIQETSKVIIENIFSEGDAEEDEEDVEESDSSSEDE
jgi:hypothetical protein